MDQWDELVATTTRSRDPVARGMGLFTRNTDTHAIRLYRHHVSVEQIVFAPSREVHGQSVVWKT
jgi:hypothetical protein